jgi:DNA repair photolyase
MPPRVSKLVDVRTDSVEKRILAINDFYAAGYEVHVNFSPVIVYEGWLDDYRLLFEQLNDTVHPEIKARMACEVIFLTHNYWQHQTNLDINPRAESVIWTPENQETKRSQFGGINVRYKLQVKAQMIASFRQLQEEIIPWCHIRYIF